MRIIGGHDYYDSALAYGQDNDVVFLREHTEILDDQCLLYNGFRGDILEGHFWQSPHLSIRDPNRGVVDLHLLPVSIYVAGVHHGGIKVIERDTGVKVEVFWDYEKFESWVTAHGKTVGKPKKRYKWEKPNPVLDVFPTVREFMTPLAANNEQLSWLIEHRVAIAVWCAHEIRYYSKVDKWRCNSAEKGWSLKDYDFPRAMDPYTLFQELSMFVGGVLPRNPNPMVEITDDNVKVSKHGFDKWSFRKHKDDN